MPEVKDLRKLLKDYEDSYLYYTSLKKEADKASADAEKALKFLDDGISKVKKIIDVSSGINTKKISPANHPVGYPGYPLKGTFYEKIRFLEEIQDWFWTRKEMESLIINAEGVERGKKTISNSSQKLFQLIDTNLVISVKYNNSSNLSFHTTRREWIKETKGEDPEIIEKHRPKNTKIDDFKNHKIKWRGIPNEN